ncbi:MAG: hypothetical protein ACTHMC_04230, partial [Pseudobacter sp.]|uniref:hypothetical protein n=1 Tax=Pseudobacter sp. TaxID=2045420 RepID=UPI003F7D5B91
HVISREGPPIFYVGDTLQHVKYAGTKAGMMKITAISTFTPISSDTHAVMSRYPELLFKTSYNRGTVLTVDTFPSMALGDLVYNESHTGKGFLIRNNKVGYNRSRGILIKSSDGIVTDNEISGTAMNGILVAPEITWMGGGFADNVEIKYNKLFECMFEKTNQGMPPGALSVWYVNGIPQVPATAGAFSQMNIHHNTIQKCPYPAMVFVSVSGLSQNNNTIEAYPCQTRQHGLRWGAVNTIPVWTVNNTP